MDRNAIQFLKNLFFTKVTNELMAYSRRALMGTRPGPGQNWLPQNYMEGFGIRLVLVQSENFVLV